MTVRVTSSDIKRGRPEMAALCPIALALQRLTGDPWHVTHKTAKNLRSKQRYQLPSVAQIFAAQFDEDVTVSPITFQLAA